MDWNSLYLLELIVMRMSGFLLVNPLFGRTTVPGIVKAGVTLAFSVFVWGAEDAAVTAPGTVAELVVRLLLELCVGLILSFVMQLFFSVVQLGGEIIDAQMGLNMAQVYDSSSQVNMTVTASLLHVLMVLTFFAENGHYTLLRIALASGKVLPYGTASLGEAVSSGMVGGVCRLHGAGNQAGPAHSGGGAAGRTGDGHFDEGDPADQRLCHQYGTQDSHRPGTAAALPHTHQ